VLVVGDAAGHGMRACMSILVMQTLMQLIRTRLYRKTAAFMSEINRRFCSQSITQKDGSLVTLLFGVLRIDRNVFYWSSAGHPVPILHDRRGLSVNPVASNEVAGAPLGVDPDTKYGGYKTSLPPGSRLLLYSDGLVEAFPESNEGRQFGIEGVKKTMFRTGGLSIGETLQALLDASHDFTEGTGRHDDTSALLLERA
jgi:serine phosphatase RsbU (regulator of sigma subunit)